MHDDLYAHVFALHSDGHTWPEIAAEVRCSEDVVRNMVDHHRATLEARANADQFTLFDAPQDPTRPMAPTSADMWPANSPTARSSASSSAASPSVRSPHPKPSTTTGPRRDNQPTSGPGTSVRGLAPATGGPGGAPRPSRTEQIHANLFSDYDGQKR